MYKKEKWQRAAYISVSVFLIAIGVYLFFRYALGIVFPFLASFTVGLPIVVIAKKSAKKLKGSYRAWGIFYLVVAFLSLALLIFLLLVKLKNEAEELLVYIGQNSEIITRDVQKLIDGIASIPSKLPLLGSILESELFASGSEQIGDALAKMLRTALEKGGEWLISSAGKLVVATPQMAISVLVFTVACVYIVMDYDKIKSYILYVLSDGTRAKLGVYTKKLARGIKGYFKAYACIFLITFGELYLGFLVLRIEYAFLLSLAIAFLDVLPFFAAGAVLLPWGILLIANGEAFVGVGMMILFLVMVVVRQIVEPRFLGKNLGIHPLATLAAVYIGMRSFGFVGMIVSPFAVMLLKGSTEVAKEAARGAKN